MSTFAKPLRVYAADKDTPNADLGDVVVAQFKELDFDADLVQDATFHLPVGAQILDIIVDVKTAFNSATSATLTVGKTSGATEYASGVNAKTTGRARPAFTAAQLANMAKIDNAVVVATVTSVGQPSAGASSVTILYRAP